MKRTALSTRNLTLRLLLIALTLSLSASACGKKNKDADAGPKVHEIKAVGVKVTAPGDWEVQKRGSRWIVRSGNLGVFFSKHPSKAPKTPKEAAALLSNSKIAEQETLAGGAIYLFYKMTFPTSKGGKSMALDFIRVYLPLDKGYAMCSVQLTSPDQKAQLAKICKSMKKI